MPKLSGHFTGKAQEQTNISLPDDHQVSFAEITGPQSVNDPNWKNSKVTYSVSSDLTRGNGRQRGYFVNERPNGDCDCGVCEAKVTTVNGQVMMEGTWKFTHGKGMFDGIQGGGTFKGRMTSPTEVDIAWEGNYQLAAQQTRLAA